MKILLFADLHMCPRASIVNKWGVKYPARLENCIDSLNWLERKAEELSCDYIINLGDFFDRPELTSETITACTEVKWSNIMHYSLVGNHDASTSSLLFNSVNSIAQYNHKIITEPCVIPLNDCFICFLPYIVECERQPIYDYFPTLKNADKPVIILSHNDIKGVQLGPVVSKTGFSIEEIEENCDLFINGHLHNGQALSEKVLNLGNLTGKDFGEDASKHPHNVAVLDTETLQLSFIENPYAYNFYKIQIEHPRDLAAFDTLKNNAIVSIKCESSLLDEAKQYINELGNKILETRFIIIKNYETVDTDNTIELSVDHIARFIECCKNNIEHTELLDEELNEICK